ncbi:MAG: tetraacyldisaccharide 4'-kinase, partial [Armatimonadetes bacterium]|nr:tetraacyldisaccharide 4'-kinase [Armatimonadota bacterium]
LLPLSLVYDVGLEAYLLPYRLGIRRKHRLPCRVVSVGNLTFGGTGKSPAVRAICEKLIDRGLRPAVLSRGHGGRMCRTGAVVSDGTRRLLDAADSGDEPAALADAVPGLPVAVCRDRRKAGRLVVEKFRPDVIVLDDGMQYWQLQRDVEIVLVSAERPFGTGLVMPAGDLREPARGIGRADAVVITGVEAVGSACVEGLIENLERLAPQAKIFLARREARVLIDQETGERVPIEYLEGVPVVAASGIANPASFENMLAQAGAEVRECIRFGDHCRYDQNQVALIEETASKTGAEAVVVTSKDAVKLRIRGKLYVLEMALEIEDIDELIDLITGD